MDEKEIARSVQLLLTQYRASYIDNVLFYKGTQDIYRNLRIYTFRKPSTHLSVTINLSKKKKKKKKKEIAKTAAG